MKKILFSMFILFFASSLFAESVYDSMADALVSGMKDKNAAVAVIPFESGSNKAIGEAVANEIVSAVTSKGVTVVERGRLNSILEEMSLQQTGLMNSDTVSEVGKGLGAKYLIVGSTKEFKKPHYSNKGLKVQARLVSVETGRILASSTVEVEKDDITLEYKRRQASGPVIYPAMIGLVGSVNFSNYHFDGSQEDLLDSTIEYEEDYEQSTLNYDIGLQYFSRNADFFGSMWDLYYTGGKIKDMNGNDYDINGFDLSWALLLKIPLWRIIEGLPFLTHIYVGPSFGFGYDKFSMLETDPPLDNSTWKFFIDVKAGLMIGLTDSVNLNVMYRYSPESLCAGWYTNSNIDFGNYDSSGHQIYLGIVLAP